MKRIAFFAFNKINREVKMENKYLMNSKIYVKPKPASFIFRILLNICLAVYLLASIVMILFEGVSIGIVGGICLAVFIVLSYNQRPSARAHYEMVQAEIGIEPDMVTIIYRQISSLKGGDAVYKIPAGQLNSIEFSDQLCCIHFIGSVTVTYAGSNSRSENKSDCYFYVEKGYEKEILSELTRVCGKDIIYRDR